MSFTSIEFSRLPAGLPKRRPRRPNRRDHGGLTPDAAAVSLPWRTAVTDVLSRYGFPPEATEDLIGEIHDALSFREHQPAGVLRVRDEREDLAHLFVRLEDLLDSMHAMANQTRCRVLDLLGVGSELDPLKLESSLPQLLWSVGKVLNGLPAGTARGGRPLYDDARETPILGLFVTIWFERFPGDAGIVRHGNYTEIGCQEYEGKLLDFLVTMYEAIGLGAGSANAIGRRVFQKSRRRRSLQDRIRERFLPGVGA